MDGIEDLIARIEHDFTWHPPATIEMQERMAGIRVMFREMAKDMARGLPPSRETAICLTKLEESSFYAMAALARYQED